MSMTVDVINYNKKDIDNFIKKYPNSKDCFEKCGAFLGDYYFIMDNEEMKILIHNYLIY